MISERPESPEEEGAGGWVGRGTWFRGSCRCGEEKTQSHLKSNKCASADGDGSRVSIPVHAGDLHHLAPRSSLSLRPLLLLLLGQTSGQRGNSGGEKVFKREGGRDGHEGEKGGMK